MADTRISGLTAASALASTDVVPVVQTTGTGPVKATAAQIATYVGANLVIPKTSGTGIKIDQTTPTYPWRDILGQISVKGTGVNDPTWASFITNISAFQFAANKECWIFYHIPHDYVPGTELYIHAHWAIATTASTGSLTWGFDCSFAKGFDQETFPATTNKTVDQAATVTAYKHMISEVQLTTSGALGGNAIEVDGMVLARVYLSANTLGQNPFLFTADIHYQSTNVGTKGKTAAGGGFYS